MDFQLVLEIVTLKYSDMMRLQVKAFIMRSNEMDCLLTEGDGQGDQEEGEEQGGRYETPPERQC